MRSKPILSDSVINEPRAASAAALTGQLASKEASADVSNPNQNNAASLENREKIFSAAISTQEKELLRKIFGGLTQIETGSKDYPALKSQTENNQAQAHKKTASLEISLAELLNAQACDGTASVENELALRILKGFVSESKATNRYPISPDKILILKERIKSIASEQTENQGSAATSQIISEIKQQSLLSPEQRGSLLQSIIPSSKEESLLLENVILRRNEIIAAKSEILALIEKMNAASFQNSSDTVRITDQNVGELLARYLAILINETAENLEQIEKSSSSKDLRLLFLQFKSLSDSPDNKSDNASISIYSELAAALRISSLADKLNDFQSGKDDSNEKSLGRALRALISQSLLKESESLNESTMLSKSTAASESIQVSHSGRFSGNLNTHIFRNTTKTEQELFEMSAEISPSALILDDLIKKLSARTTEAESDYFSAKLLEQTPRARSLLLKIDKFIQNIYIPTEPPLSTTISLDALELALAVRSPDIFNATVQLLRAYSSGKDLISSFSALLVPLLNLLSVSLGEEQPLLHSELKATIEQLEIIKNANKTGIKRKEALREEIKAALGIFDRLASDPEDMTIYDRLLADSLGKETLNRLNNLAEKLGQPKTTNLFLQPALQPNGFEITALNTPIEPDTESNKKENLRSAIEKIECSMMLPSIGECGIEISIWENKISLSICNRNQDVIEKGQSLLPKLEARLVDLAFEAPKLEMLCAEPKSVKPEWLLEILGSA